ncbi:MAG: DUF3830 family protein [Spirochaetaceae bacterium]|nr:MAG: DUF3830 family protein [Spirochaetaceae bacterium]
MAKELKLRVGNEIATFILFEDKAPKTCKRLIESLPLNSTAIIAKVAGLELMVRVPYFLDAGGENEITAQEPGNVCFVPGSQNVCVFCEDLPGLGPCSWIGRITDNLKGIQAEAWKCKQRQGAEVQIYEPDHPHARAMPTTLGKSFIDRLRAVREEMWTSKPREISEALDKSKGYTDSWDSSFFPTLYAWEETVASRNAFLTLRATLKDPDSDLNTLKLITRNLLDLYVSYFRMTNMGDTTALLREAAAEVGNLSSKTELQELLEELIRYSGRLHYWIEPLMPWEAIIQTFERAMT